MEVISKTVNSNIAKVYIARNDSGRMVEFVESTQPPLSINEKWVLIVSTLYGCPVNCSFCDAGGNYKGRLSAEEILYQIDYPVLQRYPDRHIISKKFKVQFSRMGEPTFNPAVLEVLERLPGIYQWNEFIPSLSTIAPSGTDRFFERLIKIKNEHYPETFQLQFSLHSTSSKQRDTWMPIKKWDFAQISEFGGKFYQPGGKKITLNFAIAENSIIEEKELLKFFSPEIFLVKMTPVNPTFRATMNNIKSGLNITSALQNEISQRLVDAGYDVIISIGELEENQIGSNCGQYLQTYLNECKKLPGAYSYNVQ